MMKAEILEHNASVIVIELSSSHPGDKERYRIVIDSQRKSSARIFTSTVDIFNHWYFNELHDVDRERGIMVIALTALCSLRGK